MEDDEKTRLRSMSTRTSAPRYPHDTPSGERELPAGMRLGEFEIVSLIGKGGFGIVYLAYDHSLDRHVAVKEYMPTGIASRTDAMNVTVKAQHYSEIFTAGMRSFINEARLLAKFDSPSLVKVLRFWEANGTAYMAMPFYEGITLKQAYQQGDIAPDEPWIRTLLARLLDPIETIHRENCFHRDIAPDNILLRKDGRPLLLDFGAARRVISDLTHMPTAIVKPGFAPVEQYMDISALKQGPWTDIYALAAVVYYLIAGKAPPESIARLVQDEMQPAREAGKGRFSEAFLAVIDHALAIRPEQRIQSVAALREALAMEDAARTPPVPSPAPPPKQTEAPMERPPSPIHQAAPAAASETSLIHWPYPLRVLAAVAIALGFGWGGIQYAKQELFDNLLLGSDDAVEGYLSVGGSPNVRDTVGQTPLFRPAMFGNMKVVNMLIAAGIDVNAQSDVGETALWTAAFHGHSDVAKALIAAGADVNITPHLNKSPLQIAQERGHTQVADILRQAGAKE